MTLAADVDPVRTTGGDVQRMFARMKARLVARYRLSAVPGRPEELVSPGITEDQSRRGVWITKDQSRRGVSLGYGCRTIRVRLMAGREWVRTEDFQINDPEWPSKLNAMCDTYFGYVGPDSRSVGPFQIVKQHFDENGVRVIDELKFD